MILYDYHKGHMQHPPSKPIEEVVEEEIIESLDDPPHFTEGPLDDLTF